ncbi:hypothetical protein ElyMa_006661700 [Elysia marginata]|uniref:Uncharacterized protein n=1 Tax=Elysia marginata TaxID=1093978 RepID=A0AAV4IMX0_9GAST|nr:hypothetical protein ElyMa_006661700 [Elysia marginata]
MKIFRFTGHVDSLLTPAYAKAVWAVVQVGSDVKKNASKSLVVNSRLYRPYPTMQVILFINIFPLFIKVLNYVSLIGRPALWPSGEDTRLEIGRYGFDPRPSQIKDFKIGISS